MIRKIEKIFLLSVFLVMSVCVSAQDGTYGSYSPYSIFGIGDISRQGTSFNKSMGGVGIATRNNRFINYMNPAALTARDSLSFMADFGLSQKNTIYRQGDLRSANNTFNIYDFMMSFPIWTLWNFLQSPVLSLPTAQMAMRAVRKCIPIMQVASLPVAKKCIVIM